MSNYDRIQAEKRPTRRLLPPAGWFLVWTIAAAMVGALFYFATRIQ